MLGLLVLASCGRVSFDVFDDGGLVNPNSLSVTPPANAEVGAIATIEGTCRVGVAIATLLAGAWGSNGPGTGLTPPNTMTIDGSRATSENDNANALIARQNIPAGATGDRAATVATTRAAAAALIVLRPKP